MGKPLTVAEKRNELIQQMEGHRALPEYILDGVGSLLQRLINPAAFKERNSFLPPDASKQEYADFPSYWVNGIVIAFFTFLIGIVLSAITRQPFTPDELKLTLWASATGALALIANKINIRAFLNTFHNSCANKMLRVEDMEDLEKWLNNNFDWKKPLFSGLVFGPVLGWLLYANWLVNHTNAAFRAGPFTIIILSCIQSLWVAYYLYPFYVAFPSRLNRYHFDLYTTDPSSSEVVGRLTRLLTFLLYVTIGYIVQLTIGLAYVNVLTTETPISGIVFSIFVWAPTVIMYAAGQYHLSDLIARAKWKILNDIQTKVESLYAGKKTPDRDTLEQLEKLMDYHDRIKGTPNSALNFRASLNFLNSLLLPILAFIAANLKDVVNLFK